MTFADPNGSVFGAAVGKRVESINFARLPIPEPRMRVEIHLVGARFMIDDCDQITNEEVNALVGSTITRVTVETSDDADRHWLPARLTISVDKSELRLVTYVPIFYMNEDTRMFNRFPVPARLEDDRSGFHNPFGFHNLFRARS